MEQKLKQALENLMNAARKYWVANPPTEPGIGYDDWSKAWEEAEAALDEANKN